MFQTFSSVFYCANINNNFQFFKKSDLPSLMTLSHNFKTYLTSSQVGNRFLTLSQKISQTQKNVWSCKVRFQVRYR